jgi:hypothetical protein
VVELRHLTDLDAVGANVRLVLVGDAQPGWIAVEFSGRLRRMSVGTRGLENSLPGTWVEIAHQEDH